MNPSPVKSLLEIDSIAAAVDAVLDAVPGDIVLGIPLGIGKPNPFVNALYLRIKANSSRRLTIVTALSLELPVGKSELERHFLEPLVERVFADYPDLDYVKDLRGGGLPANIQVREFFMKTGDYLGNRVAQQGFVSTNYSFVARDMLLQGLNVVAQAVASNRTGGPQADEIPRPPPEGASQPGSGPSLTHVDDWKLSLSSNPDVILELAQRCAAEGKSVLKVAVVNDKMPFMPNGAEVAADFFDIVVTDPAGTHALFAPPNGKVSTADHAIGLHASSLVVDGGTLQIGIGSLGDAICQALIVRHRNGAEYLRILQSICPDGLVAREMDRFDRGLYGCSEMFVNGFMKLIEAGIIRRQVFADATLQTLVNEGRIATEKVTPTALRALLDAGRIHSPLSADELAFLIRFGIFKSGVRIDGQHLVWDDVALPNDLADSASFDAIAKHLLGQRLASGIIMSAGFFLGPNDFYERLRSMPALALARIDMTRIDAINQLEAQDGSDARLRRLQRRKPRFMNTTMQVTLLGAAASDSLESGQVVSGVGGQYNFVAMAHALPDARSILMLRATHDNRDGLRSSIVWSHANITLPRHLRDIVITEYGIADLRGQCDSEVVKRMLAIADSRFQLGLLREAQAHGKLEADYELPERYGHNLPEALDAKLHPWSQAGLLPAFPFGTDLTADELHIVTALKRLKRATEHPVELVTLAVRSLWEGKQAPHAYLERLGLDEAHSFKDMFIRKLFAGNL